MWVLALSGPGLVLAIIAMPAVTALWVHLTEGQSSNATLRALLGITTSGGEMESSARSSSVQSSIEKDRRAGSLQPNLLHPPTSTPGTTKDDSTRVGTNPAVVKTSTKSNAKNRGSSTVPARRAVDAILIDPEALNALTKFAALEFCVENLLFISAVDEFRLRCARAKAKDLATIGASSPFSPGEASPVSPMPPGSQMPSDRVRYAQRVVADFIKAGSVNEVNIPSQIRREIEETFKECCNNPESILPDSIFDSAYKHVENMLITDIIPRFKKSKLYVEPRKSGGRPV
ncbi:RGS domain-containing protein [Gaertneriomyces semiglobifer]|nr:RGS domain-containing protein [Gaertneriomyces semiglobifer]KAI9017280.1 RGS domain-containing protein [Gaertneriomyces semiglobifer]